MRYENNSHLDFSSGELIKHVLEKKDASIDPSILQPRKTWDDSHAYDGLDTIT